MGTAERWTGLDEWPVVRQFLPDDWEAAARQTGALRRARGIPDAPTLLRALLVHLAEGCSLAETAVRVRAAGWCVVSAVALLKRLRAAEEWLRWLAEGLWREKERPVNWGGYRVRAVDATTVQEPGNTGTDWRVHYVINLASLQCEHFELTDVHGGETFRRIPVVPGDLLLGDRAYGTPTGIAHVRAAGADVLVRASHHRLPLYDESEKKLAILSRLRTLRVSEVREWPAWVRFGQQVWAGRLVAVKRGRQATRAAQRRLRRTARRKQVTVSPAALRTAAYVFVWTSVPAEKLIATEVMELYRLRWQIELAFKRLKSLMGLGHLPKWSDASCRAWIHGKLFIALLTERLLAAAEAVSPWGYRLVTTP